jgi:hypothetical protein
MLGPPPVINSLKSIYHDFILLKENLHHRFKIRRPGSKQIKRLQALSFSFRSLTCQFDLSFFGAQNIRSLNISMNDDSYYAFCRMTPGLYSAHKVAGTCLQISTSKEEEDPFFYVFQE